LKDADATTTSFAESRSTTSITMSFWPGQIDSIEEEDEGDEHKQHHRSLGITGVVVHDATPPPLTAGTGDDTMMTEPKAGEKPCRRPARPYKYGFEDDDDAHAHDDAHDHDDDDDAIVLAEEVTIPVVDAAFASTTTTSTTAIANDRLRAAERRTAVANAARRVAEARLADENRLLPSIKPLQKAIAMLPKKQWYGLLGGLGMIFAMAIAMIGICEAPGSGVSCGRRSGSTTNSPSTTTVAPLLSARAQFIVDYINNITLTGRTLSYPDDATPEGRALAWLIDKDEEKEGGNDNNYNGTSTASTTTTAKTNDEGKVSLRQRYALATLWFQTPNLFDNTFFSPNTTWGTSLHECNWYSVTCSTGSDGSNTPGLVVDSLRLISVVRGGIPHDLGLLTDLTAFELSLAGDGLVGTIPSSLGNHLTALTYLGLFLNSLTGTIPTSLAALTGLLELHLNDNALTGAIPSQLGELTALTGMYLSNNALSGTIPSQLGGMTALQVLYLFGNALTGTISSELGQLTALTELWLNDNSLTGTIPSQLGDLTALTRLSLSNNSLTGTIPSRLGSLTALNRLSFANITSTKGTIPSQLAALTALTSLILSHNALTGTIPAWLGDLTALTRLVLRGNLLTGTISSSLTALSNLTALHLYDNGLNGTVPFCDGENNKTLNHPSLTELVADCAETSCTCCTHCCPSSGWDGILGFGLCDTR
jgi:Leucine-rich repeat (LRR) protein